MAKAKRLPTQPRAAKVVERAWARGLMPAKFVPREPRDGEVMLLVQRPQMADGSFETFAAGDFLAAQPAFIPSHPMFGTARDATPARVIVAAKAPYTRRVEGTVRYEQIVLVRDADAADSEAVADQMAEQEADHRRTMDGMMSR